MRPTQCVGDPMGVNDALVAGGMRLDAERLHTIAVTGELRWIFIINIGCLGPVGESATCNSCKFK